MFILNPIFGFAATAFSPIAAPSPIDAPFDTTASSPIAGPSPTATLSTIVAPSPTALLQILHLYQLLIFSITSA